MRVWDIPIANLCNKHLVAQHHELHCIYSIIMNGKKGFAHHPEVLRFHARVGSIVGIHDQVVAEMITRKMNHYTPLPCHGIWLWPPSWQTIEEQVRLLKAKGCQCKV